MRNRPGGLIASNVPPSGWTIAWGRARICRSRCSRTVTKRRPMFWRRTPVPLPLEAVTGGTPSPKALKPDASAAAEARRFRVNLDGLALRTAPDANGGVLARLAAGDFVTALDPPPRGAWMPVQWGQGEA